MNRQRTLIGACGIALSFAAASAQPLQITGFFPVAGGVGDVVTISGFGFGSDADSLNASLLNLPDALPLTVIEAHDTMIRARIDAVPMTAMPGPIRLGIGTAKHDPWAGAYPDVIQEGGAAGTWTWSRAGDAREATSLNLFTPLPPMPPMPWVYTFGQVSGGRLSITLSGDWAPNTAVSIFTGLHSAVIPEGGAMTAFPLRARIGGNARYAANRVADAIQAALATCNITVSCQVVAVGVNSATITASWSGSGGEPIPIDWGHLVVATQAPALSNHFPVGPVTAFLSATLSDLPAGVLVGNLGPSGNDGATVSRFSMLPVVPRGVRIATQEIPIGIPGASLGVQGWGSFDARTAWPLVGVRTALNALGGVDFFCDATPLDPLNVIRVEVFYNTAHVGGATIQVPPASPVCSIFGPSPAVPPAVNQVGLALGPTYGAPPLLWLDLDRAATFGTPLWPPLTGNQLRLSVPNAPAVGDIQALDLAAAGTASSGSYLMTAAAEGRPCYPNCDRSYTAPALNVMDFACFLNEFAAGRAYANCDGSTTTPVLNVLDFACFLNAFAAGCP